MSMDTMELDLAVKPRHVRTMENSSRTALGRSTTIDAVKGLAVAFMIVFHFCFDLSTFGFARFDFNFSPFWLNFRLLIMTMFMTVVGVNLVQAKGSKKPRAMLKRQTKLLICALLVTLGSYLAFPRAFIYFGVLHFVFVASLIGYFFTDFMWTNLFLGLGVLLAGFYAHPFFNPKYLNWIGFTTRKPFTEDYSPLFPWMGLVFIGMFLAHLVFQKRPGLLKLPAPAFLRWMGAHSLVIYILHQPILFGIFYLIVNIRL